MKIEDTVAFVTGSNRGLGRALVDALLARGARRVYAGTRTGATLHGDPRVTPVRIDVTKPAEVRAAAALAQDTRLLINNAGVLASFNALTAEPQQLHDDLQVNALGMLDVARAFAPVLVTNQPSAIVNVLSVVALGSMPALGGYSASKAAAWSFTQALRAELGAKGVQVHAVFPGPIDTDMIKTFDMPKTSAADVARAILDGVLAGNDNIAPDPMSASVLETYLHDPRAVERQFSR